MPMILEAVRKGVSNPRATIARLRPLAVVIVLFFVFQALFFEIAAVSQDSARHVVDVKQSWAEDKDIIRDLPGKDTVLFMGDSKIVGGVIPEVFDQETGEATHSYNVALPGLPLAPHYFWLKDYLEVHEPPDYIVLSLKKAGWDFFHFANYTVQIASLPEVLQYSRVSGNREMIINYFLPMRFNWDVVKRYLIGRLYLMAPGFVQEIIKDKYRARQLGRETYRHDWEYFFDTQFVFPERRWLERKEFLRRHRGFYDFREARAQGGIMPDDYEYVKKGDWGESSDELPDPFVEKFFDLTAEQGIQVILINEYILESQVATEQVKDIPELWKDLARKYDHVRFPEKDFQKKVYPNHYFSDPLHLTTDGAVLYSRHVAEIFNRLTAAGGAA